MDTSTKHPMTYEQARHLFLNMGEAIRELEPNVDKLAQTLSHIENINMMDNYTLNVTKNALTCQLTISLIHLDLCAATRQYLSGLTNYDQRFAIKNLQAILNEAYKRVFGFSSTKLKDTLIYPLISSLSDEDKDKYRSYLDKMASIKSNFHEPTIFNKESRCMIYHYSNDILKAHKFLSDIDADVVIHASNQFLSVIVQLSEFVHNLLLDFDKRMMLLLESLRNTIED